MNPTRWSVFMQQTNLNLQTNKLKLTKLTQNSFRLCVKSNWPFQSYCEPPYENEAKCKAFHLKIIFVCI